MTDATAPEARKSGWYWIETGNIKEHWEVAYWTGERWLRVDDEMDGRDVFPVDEHRLERPPRAEPPAGEMAEAVARLRDLLAKATPGHWRVEPYYIRPGTPDEVTRGMLMAGEHDDFMPTGIIDENDMPFNDSESLSHNLDLIVAMHEELPMMLRTLATAAERAGQERRAGAEAMREKAAQLRDPSEAPPCDCAYETTSNGAPCWIYDCHCSNSGDLARVESWCADKNAAAAIRTLPLEDEA